MPGPAAALLQSGWGSRCCPALQWRRNSPARQQHCLVQQHRGNPCRHGHCCCPAELGHQGAGLVPSQQSLPSICSWWPLLWDFIPCLPVQSSKPPSGPQEGGTCLCVECKAFLVDTQQGLPSLAPALVYRAHCPKCIPSDSSPTLTPCDGSMAVLHPVLH